MWAHQPSPESSQQLYCVLKLQITNLTLNDHFYLLNSQRLETTIVTMTTRRLHEKVTIIKDEFCEFIYDMS